MALLAALAVSPRGAAEGRVVGAWVAGEGVAVWVAAGGGWVGVGVEVEGEGSKSEEKCDAASETNSVGAAG